MTVPDARIASIGLSLEPTTLSLSLLRRYPHLYDSMYGFTLNCWYRFTTLMTCFLDEQQAHLE